MALPERCFCGCGEPANKLNAANLEGYNVAFELGYWLNYISIMKRAGPDHDWSEVHEFMHDGAICYRMLRDEVHLGAKPRRKERKALRRWLKFSRNSREKIGAGIAPDQPNPFEATPFPRARQVREWVYEGTLLPIEE